MKCVFVLISSIMFTKSQGQDLTAHLITLRQEFKSVADSISTEIDKNPGAEILSDTISVFDPNDIEKFHGLYIEQKYYSGDRNLRLVISATPEQEQTRYYFSDAYVVKALIIGARQSYTSTYYFSKMDNELDEEMVFRLVRKYPSTSDYFKHWEIAKSYLKEKR